LPQADLDMVRNCGVDVVKWSIGGFNADFVETVKQIAYIHQMIEIDPAYFTQVRIPADMTRAKREGKMGIIFSFESVDMLEGKLDRIELFRDLGVRVMQFSYNRKSPFGAGVMEPNGGGLTPLGQEAMKKMNALGIAVDVSHANRKPRRMLWRPHPNPRLCPTQAVLPCTRIPETRRTISCARWRTWVELSASTICRT